MKYGFRRRAIPVIVNDAGKKRSFVDRMIHSRKTMAIFYGSQTGTAEDFAQRIARQARHYGISALVCNPDECDMVSRSTTVGVTLEHCLPSGRCVWISTY